MPPPGLPRIAVIDDTQRVAEAAADWAALGGRAKVVFFPSPFADEADAAARLRDFEIIVPMRERTAFTASLIGRLPKLRLIAMTGARAPTLDVASCTERGVLVCNTGINTTAATAELAFGLMLSCARAIPCADGVMRAGGWHGGVPVGHALEGRRLGILGLGKLGSRVASYGKAFGMDVVAWSQNLTDAAAASQGVRRVEKAGLFAGSDIVSVHLVLSERTRGIVGPAELGAMPQGAILVNTARGPLVQEAALLDALRAQRIWAGLDVFGQEPLPERHPLRDLGNVVLTPHLGYATQSVFAQFYRESVANIAAFLDGSPVRMVNPEAAGAATAR